MQKLRASLVTLGSLALLLSLAGFTAKKKATEPAAAVPATAGVALAGWGKPVEQNTAGVNQIESEYAPGAIQAMCEKALTDHQKALDAIAALPKAQRSAKNVLLEFERVNAEFGDITNPLTFMKYVSTVESTQNEGGACEEKVSQYLVSVFARKDLYAALRDAKPTTPAQKRLSEKTLLAFERNGLKLSDEKAVQVKALRTEIEKLQADFSDNLNKDDSSLEFTTEQLKGAPEDFLNRLKKSNDGKRLVVTTKSTDYQVVMKNVVDSDVRRQMLIKYWNRAAEKNTPLLKAAIAKRREVATLMGYDSWLAFQVADRTAKNRKTVEDFLNGLRAKLSARNQAELARLAKVKLAREPDSKGLNLWDIEFMRNTVRKQEFNLDEEVVRTYFPANVVVKGLFEIYSTLLGVKFTEVSGAKVWAPKVKLYKIEDAKSGEVIGGFYTDFVPRSGKYGHAAAFTIFSGRMLHPMVDSEYLHPTSAIVANFTPPANGKPSLLTHDEVETFFHEFGHIMHQTLTRAPYASLSGSSTAQDFVEAPSQMLENWVYDEKVLNLLSGHYEDNAKKLPPELRKTIIAVREFDQGAYFYTRQLVFGLIDVKYHTAQGDVDPSKTYDTLFSELIGVAPPEGTNFPASFGHLMGGYDAGYYGYLWSEVFADDMFSKFQKEGLLNPATGMRYRKLILERGNMLDNERMLNEFLGRKWSNAAFFKRMGIH